MGVPEPDRLRFVGLFGALIFVVGMPLVPLWGVWADKYSRKAVVIRSALVEAVVFAAVALSREPSAAELASVKSALGDDREEAFRDLFWALLNSKEFAFNH